MPVDRTMPVGGWGWPESDAELVDLQVRLAEVASQALSDDPWLPPSDGVLFGGCFVTYPRGGTGPGRAGDEAWAAAVSWRMGSGTPRRADHHLRAASVVDRPRQADDVVAQAFVVGRVAAPYVPGLLARREGPLLAAALGRLEQRPELVLVDASGLDHPRGAGLAVHLGAVVGLPTVGVTRRPLLAVGQRPSLQRGARTPLHIGERCVAHWVCTRSGAQPLVAHAGWRTSPETAVEAVLEASTPAGRTPVPLQEARRVAREARSLGLRPGPWPLPDGASRR